MKCRNCNKEIKNKNKYCSVKCQKEYEYMNFIKKWKEGETSGNERRIPTLNAYKNVPIGEV